MNAVGVLTVHHEDEIRRSARAAVNATPGFDAVGEAASAEEALELAMALRPDLALVGVGMPGIDGFETSRRLVDALPDTKVILLYGAAEPSESVLAGSRAAAVMHAKELAPGSLQTLWADQVSS
jgi:DNA-binding NarL/FixJ family response regulator